MSNEIRDEFYKMSPEKARKIRESFENQLYSKRARLINAKNRRDKVIQKLDDEIKNLETQIIMISNTIEEIDRCHFNTVEGLDLNEMRKYDDIL